ncbi:hypothetical protein Z043_123227 [Scleropages formosus]|uniref:Uncharacterized protein n=1 Tax=Scleropages formosus TaxID=113540 RepID=A0A0P7TMH9_SCLFO|nr:hypothetical protein Z043_123227 [Scleropages formosus]
MSAAVCVAVMSASFFNPSFAFSSHFDTEAGRRGCTSSPTLPGFVQVRSQLLEDPAGTAEQRMNSARCFSS